MLFVDFITKIYIFALSEVDKKMIKVDKITAVILTLLLALASASAQIFPTDTHSAERLSSREGLPFDYVDHIFQDDAGFIWIS